MGRIHVPVSTLGRRVEREAASPKVLDRARPFSDLRLLTPGSYSMSIRALRSSGRHHCLSRDAIHDGDMGMGVQAPKYAQSGAASLVLCPAR